MTEHLKRHKDVWQEFQEARKNMPLEIEKKGVRKKLAKTKAPSNWEIFHAGPNLSNICEL